MIDNAMKAEIVAQWVVAALEIEPVLPDDIGIMIAVAVGAPKPPGPGPTIAVTIRHAPTGHGWQSYAPPSTPPSSLRGFVDRAVAYFEEMTCTD